MTKAAPLTAAELFNELSGRDIDLAPFILLDGEVYNSDDLLSCEHCNTWLTGDGDIFSGDDGPILCLDCDKEAVAAEKDQRSLEGWATWARGV